MGNQRRLHGGGKASSGLWKMSRILLEDRSPTLGKATAPQVKVKYEQTWKHDVDHRGQGSIGGWGDERGH